MKSKHLPIRVTAFIILTGLISVASADALIISNSSFETGNLDGWSSSGQAAAINWNGTPPGGGTYNAFLSYVGGWGLIWQNVGTLQANTDYTLSFYGASAYWEPSAQLLANFSAFNTNSNTGTTLAQEVLSVTANGTTSDWTQYNLSLPAAVVDANFSSWIGTDLSIYFGTANGDPVVVDLVSLDAVVVPEPTATSYLVASLIVFLCLGVTMRRSRWIVSGSESQRCDSV